MEVTQTALERIFSQLRIIHKAHWKAPQVEYVQKEIKEKSVFVFRIGADPHVAEVRITKDKVQYDINMALPERMQKQTEDMKKKFDQIISSS